MAGAAETRQRRLEDYIDLAGQGRKVRVDVKLRKEVVRQKRHREETADMSDETGMYLLIGEFTLAANGESSVVSKVYAYGSEEESLESAGVNRSIASQRLKMDYKRLRDANIEVDEKTF